MTTISPRSIGRLIVDITVTYPALIFVMVALAYSYLPDNSRGALEIPYGIVNAMYSQKTNPSDLDNHIRLERCLDETPSKLEEWREVPVNCQEYGYQDQSLDEAAKTILSAIAFLYLFSLFLGAGLAFAVPFVGRQLYELATPPFLLTKDLIVAVVTGKRS